MCSDDDDDDIACVMVAVLVDVCWVLVVYDYCRVTWRRPGENWVALRVK